MSSAPWLGALCQAWQGGLLSTSNIVTWVNIYKKPSTSFLLNCRCHWQTWGWSVLARYLNPLLVGSQASAQCHKDKNMFWAYGVCRNLNVLWEEAFGYFMACFWCPTYFWATEVMAGLRRSHMSITEEKQFHMPHTSPSLCAWLPTGSTALGCQGNREGETEICFYLNLLKRENTFRWPILKLFKFIPRGCLHSSCRKQLPNILFFFSPNQIFS